MKTKTSEGMALFGANLLFQIIIESVLTEADKLEENTETIVLLATLVAGIDISNPSDRGHNIFFR